MKKKSKRRGRKPNKVPVARQEQSTPKAAEALTHQRLRKTLKVALGFAITALGLMGTINGIWGPPWPTRPTIVPGTPSFGSPFDVPFRVTNRSAIFWLSNLEINCQFKWIRTTQAAFRNSGAAAIGSPQALGPLESRPYTCPLRGIVSVDAVDAADQRIVEAQISFKSEYDTFFSKRRATSESEVFTLNTATSPAQWNAGTPLR